MEPTTAGAFTWAGISGKPYQYWVTPLDAEMKAEAGNFIFAKQGANGVWYPLYIGETADLSSALLDRDSEECVRKNGATHLHTHTASAEHHVRLHEVTDLRLRWKPICNQQSAAR